MAKRLIFKLMFRGPGFSQEVTLKRGITYIGREPGNDIQIPLPKISRRHASFECLETVCILQDLGSANGTIVDGVRLQPNVPMSIGDNNLIEIDVIHITLKTEVVDVAEPTKDKVAPDTVSRAVPTAQPDKPPTQKMETPTAEPVPEEKAAPVEEMPFKEIEAALEQVKEEEIQPEVIPPQPQPEPTRSGQPEQVQPEPEQPTPVQPVATPSETAPVEETYAEIAKVEEAKPKIEEKVIEKIREEAQKEIKEEVEKPEVKKITAKPGSEEPPEPPSKPPRKPKSMPGEPEKEGIIPPGLSIDSVRLLEYLPGIYHTEFMSHFMALFESILMPLEWNIDNFDLYLSPGTTPESFLPWLAGWYDILFDSSWPEDKRRVLLHEANEIYSRRGTRRALSRLLEIYTGEKPEILEFEKNMEAHTFKVIIKENPTVDKNLLTRMIDASKPAHTSYQLEIIRE